MSRSAELIRTFEQVVWFYNIPVLFYCRKDVYLNFFRLKSMIKKQTSLHSINVSKLTQEIYDEEDQKMRTRNVCVSRLHLFPR